MKKLLIALIFSVTSLAYAQDCISNEIPDIVTESMEAAVTSGSLLDALDIWHREGHLRKFTVRINYERNVLSIKRIERKNYGIAISYENIFITSPIVEIKQIYTVLKYENGAIFIKLNCHQLINGEWDIKDYMYDTDPSKILPDSYYN